MDRSNISSEHDQTNYYYKVYFLVTSSIDGEPDYKREEDFLEDSLPKCRTKAVDFYLQQQQRMNERGQLYDLPFENYSEHFERGQNASFSLTLYLVERRAGKDVKYPIAGESKERTTVGRHYEQCIYAELNEAVDYKGLEMEEG